MKTRILIVDDSKLIRDLICDILSEDSNLEIVGQAPDGLTAIRTAAVLRPDVVTMDIQMPHLNGFEATEVIREVSASSVVIFVSADCTEKSMERAYEVGAAAFVAKDRIGEHLLPAVKMVKFDVSPHIPVEGKATELGKR